MGCGLQLKLLYIIYIFKENTRSYKLPHNPFLYKTDSVAQLMTNSSHNYGKSIKKIWNSLRCESEMYSSHKMLMFILIWGEVVIFLQSKYLCQEGNVFMKHNLTLMSRPIKNSFIQTDLIDLSSRNYKFSKTKILYVIFIE